MGRIAARRVRSNKPRGWLMALLVTSVACGSPSEGRDSGSEVAGGVLGLHAGTLVSVDWRAVGDGLISLDTVTCIQWLDVTHTQGRSYDDVSVSIATPGDELHGWAYATADQVVQMWAHAGINTTETLYTELNYQPIKELAALVGVTETNLGSTSATSGITSTPYVSDARRLARMFRDDGNQQGRATANAFHVSDDLGGVYNAGSYLIRPDGCGGGNPAHEVFSALAEAGVVSEDDVVPSSKDDVVVATGGVTPNSDGDDIFFASHDADTFKFDSRHGNNDEGAHVDVLIGFALGDILEFRIDGRYFGWFENRTKNKNQATVPYLDLPLLAAYLNDDSRGDNDLSWASFNEPTNSTVFVIDDSPGRNGDELTIVLFGIGDVTGAIECPDWSVGDPPTREEAHLALVCLGEYRAFDLLPSKHDDVIEHPINESIQTRDGDDVVYLSDRAHTCVYDSRDGNNDEGDHVDILVGFDEDDALRFRIDGKFFEGSGLATINANQALVTYADLPLLASHLNDASRSEDDRSEAHYIEDLNSTVYTIDDSPGSDGDQLSIVLWNVNGLDAGCVPTETPEASCADGLDNDCDGLVDGADIVDCSGGCVGLPAGAVCRPSAGPCDIAEVCHVSSPECPSDVLAPDGTPCLGEGTCQDRNYLLRGVCVGAGTCLGDEPGLVFNGIDYAACLARGECESPASLAHQCAADVLARTSCEGFAHLEQLTNVCGAALTAAENCDACFWTGLMGDCALCVLDLEYLINYGKSCGSAYSIAECIGECVPGDEICDGQDNDCDGVIDEMPAVGYGFNDSGLREETSLGCGESLVVFDSAISCLGSLGHVTLSCEREPSGPRAEFLRATYTRTGDCSDDVSIDVLASQGCAVLDGSTAPGVDLLLFRSFQCCDLPPRLCNVDNGRCGDARVFECKPDEVTEVTCQLIDWYMEGRSLAGAQLYGTDLRGVVLRFADLTDADLYKANLSNAALEHANLTDADLNLTNFSGASLQAAQVSGALVAYADLRGTDLRGVDLATASWFGATYNDDTQFDPGVDPSAYRMFFRP